MKINEPKNGYYRTPPFSNKQDKLFSSKIDTHNKNLFVSFAIFACNGASDKKFLP